MYAYLHGFLSNGREIHMTQEKMADNLNMPLRTFKGVLKRLQDKGFVSVTIKGGSARIALSAELAPSAKVAPSRVQNLHQPSAKVALHRVQNLHPYLYIKKKIIKKIINPIIKEKIKQSPRTWFPLRSCMNY